MSDGLIVIDGPARSGKGTLAAELAKHRRLLHLDSGAFYRAVGVMADEQRVNPFSVAQVIDVPDLLRSDLRSDKASQAASRVAAIPEVRLAVNVRIRDIIRRVPGCVMDGRAGAYEFPEARLRIFLDAHSRTRAERHLNWLQERGEDGDIDTIEVELISRDEIDKTREIFPLRYDPSVYHVRVACTNLTIEQMVERALEYCEAMSGAIR